MQTLYLDLVSGISGDMFIGALLDLGIDAAQLERELGKLELGGYHLHFTRSEKSSIAGTKFDVHLSGGHDHGHHHHHDEDDEHEHEHHGHAPGSEHSHGHSHSHEHEHGHPHGHEHSHDHSHSHGDDEHRTFAAIQRLIESSSLSPWVKQKAVAVFRRVAVAEGQIHGLPPDQVHFHEVGAIDSIVDIVGACVGLELLGKPTILASKVVDGNGWIDCAHGRFPIPAPATLAILGARGIGVTQCSEPHELVTPTGAALLAEFAESFGPMQGLVAEKIGFGLGTRDLNSRPNIVRAVLGRSEGQKTTHDWETDSVVVLEANLDDINAEVLGFVIETALAQGALDAFHTPVQMKKSRPGVLLTILCVENEADKFSELILRETTSFGVRRHTAERRKLRREMVEVKTQFGSIHLKVGRLDGTIVQAAPEYEDCKRAAVEFRVPIKAVYDAAVKQFNAHG